ncbi:hypothetical protein SCLCIDRAFT_1223610 [Scleroderma citrinum Foug A]|uniref:Copper acquisition factor BIM1-like domain-containing protein n=1 Tax=Scleroderma citrinum Foug A TaxID=1036808 RepID=A0A0C3D8A0_9AGAM|nr:hypothetical protein SCLCIDRAFT_1223610 [Scleroderma citrinum Foug A]
MHFATIFPLALAAIANAHFQMQYPIPRGPFVQDSEPTFCDGYSNVTTNRTVFPLTNGVINLYSEHPKWTIGGIVSTDQDPTSFSDFNSSSGYQMVVQFFQTSGEGQYCFPIDFANSNVSGVQDGANVTLQLIYNGGDGNLYQCADLTLSANATLPGNATSDCTNVTVSATGSTTTGGAKKEGTAVWGLVTAVVLGLAVSFL